jgi:hypothetical protein
MSRARPAKVLGEVESALRAHPAVTDAVVAAKTDGAGDRRLVGYVVVGRRDADLGGVRSFVARSLPAFMVPAALVVLPGLTLSPNGKVDRRALPQPPEAVMAPVAVEPAAPVEQRVAAVLASVLGVGRIGRDDDFFALGGDSWKAIIAIQKIGVDGLGVADLLRNPTVRGLAAALSSRARPMNFPTIREK